MLSINNVDYSYPNQNVFTNLNLELNSGEFSFLIGKSGSGKSTLTANDIHEHFTFVRLCAI